MKYTLMYSPRPWERKTWIQVRTDADNILIEGKVRDKPLAEQNAFMNPDQQKDMSRYISTAVEPKEQKQPV